MHKIYQKILKKVLPSVLSLLLLFPPYVFSPLLPTVNAAIQGTFSANQTIANVSSSTIPAVTFAGGANAVATTSITAADPSGGVNEVLSRGSIEITAAAAGSVDTITVNGVDILGGVVPFTVDAATTASAVVTQINSYNSTPEYTASSNGTDGVIVIIATAGSGATPNGFVVDGTSTTLTLGNKTNMGAVVTGVTEVKASTTTSSFVAVTSQAGADLTLNIGGTSITLVAGNSAIQAATSVASQINAAGGNSYTATVVNTDQVQLTAKASGTAGNTTLVASDLDYNTAAAIAATVTITIPAGTTATTTDHSVTIDGVTIDVGTNRTAAQVAATIAAANFTTGTNYGTGAYTVTNPSGADVTFTKNATGTGGNGAVTIADSSYGATAQVVTFTPTSVLGGQVYRGTINGTNYDYTAANGATVQSVVEGLQPLMDANGAVTCTEDDTAVTCTADAAGTAFTYAASVFDNIAPTASIGTVTVTGGTVVSGKWNSTNTGINIGVTVPNDPTLTGGTIQLQASRNAGGYANIGSAYTVLVGDLNTTKTMSLTDTEFEAIPSLVDTDVVTFKAVITDSNTNSSTSSASSSITVDQAGPTVSTITTKDSNLDGKVETATIVFNEAVLDSSFSASNFTIGGVTANSITTGTADDNTFDVVLTSGVVGTGAKTVAYTPGSGTDLAGNAAGSFSQTSTDGANPVLSAAQTQTTSTIDVTFTEALNFTSVATTDFTVSGNTVTGVTNPSSSVVRLTLGSSIGTGATPAVTLGGDGVNDANGNTLASAGPVTPTDGIAPTLSSVSIGASNPLSALFAMVGTFATLSFTTSENITTTPTVTIAGHSVTVSGGPTNWTTSYQFVSGDTEGAIPFTINVTDPAGNAATQVTTTTDASSVTLDKTAPTTPGTPSTTTPTGSTAPQFSWSASTDGLSGIAGYYYRISGSATVALTAIANVTSYTVNLVQGVYNFFVTAFDYAGNTSAESSAGTVTVDTTAPTVSADNASSSWRSSNVTITLSVGDTGGASLNASRVRYNWDATANATTGTVFTDGTTISIPSEGSHTLNLYAEDNAGNSNTFNGTYKLDSTDPSVSATGASSSWQTSMPTITVSVSDTPSGLAIVKYNWDATANASTGTDAVNGDDITSSYPGEGNHTLNIYAQDNSGRSNTFTGTYKVDTQAPTSGTLSINSGSVYVGSTAVTLTVSGTDAASGVTDMAFSNDGSTFSSFQGIASSASWNLTSGDGSKTVYVRFRDAAGNANVSPVANATTTLDTGLPIISNVSINNVTTSNNNYVRNGQTVNVTATITDSNQSAITTSMLRADLSQLGAGSNIPANTYNTSSGLATWTNLVIGNTGNATLTVTVNASDAAGNSASSQTDSITLDNAAPTTSITAPANNSFSKVNPTFTASATDPSGVVSVKFQYKAQSAGSYTDLNTDTTSPYAANWGSTALVDGTVYDLQVVSLDTAGNSAATGGVSFTYDVTAPTVTVSSPINGTTTTASVNVGLTTNETANCTIAVDGGSAGALTSTGSTSHTHSLSSLSAGSHTLAFVCTDTATNSTNKSTTFSVVNSSGSSIDAGGSNVSLNSGTDGQADLPGGITNLTLANNTVLDLSSAINTAASGNIVIGGSTVALNNYTGGSLSGVNLTNPLTIGTQQVTVGSAVRLESGTNGESIVLSNANAANSTSVLIPDGTTIMGPSGWNGQITPPKQVSSVGTAPSGFQLGTTTYEYGSPDAVLIFDKAVTIIFPGNAPIAYKSAGSSTWVQITTACGGTYANPTAPAFPGECSITDGSNTKVLTYHFTTFAALTSTSSSPGSSTPGAFYCSDSKPGSAPTLLWARAGQNEVTLMWSAAVDPVSYYLVAYGTSPGSLEYGNPNAGNRDANTYTIKGLSGGKTYYFKVRAGNGCTPGDYSNEISATPSGGYIEGAAEGFQYGVLGASTSKDGETIDMKDEASREAKKKEAGMGDVLGDENETTEDAQTKGTSSKKTTAIALTVVAVLAAGVWYFRRRR